MFVNLLHTMTFIAQFFKIFFYEYNSVISWEFE